MVSVLFVDCCVRGEASRTRALCEAFLDELKRGNEEISVKHLLAYREELGNLNEKTLALRDGLAAEKKWRDPVFRYAREIAEADYILIGAPYWDLSFPACLKTYIETTSVCGITFKYVEDKSVGLCRAKGVMYISTAGGFVQGTHAGEEYLRQISRFYGIGGFETYCVEGLDIWGTDVAAKMAEAEKSVRNLADKWKI